MRARPVLARPAPFRRDAVQDTDGCSTGENPSTPGGRKAGNFFSLSHSNGGVATAVVLSSWPGWGCCALFRVGASPRYGSACLRNPGARGGWHPAPCAPHRGHGGIVCQRHPDSLPAWPVPPLWVLVRGPGGVGSSATPPR